MTQISIHYFQASYGEQELSAEELALKMLMNSIPGTPGEDYPIYAEVPESDFSCEGKKIGGYYADPSAECQVFHVCATDSAKSGPNSKWSFLCPNGTIFNQNYFICDWWFNFDCAEAEGLYGLNDALGATDDQAEYGSKDDQSQYGAASTQQETYQNLPVSNAADPAQKSYGAPAAAPAQKSYGAPAQESYGAPADTGYGAPADSGYGAPSDYEEYEEAPADDGYGAPADEGYGAPADTGYGAPADSGYGAPADSGYGAPAQESAPANGYGAPPAPAQSSYGAPAQSSYGAPAQDSAPAKSYGAPPAPAQASYGAPAQTSYGAPAQDAAPSTDYGAPLAEYAPTPRTGRKNGNFQRKGRRLQGKRNARRNNKSF